MGQRELIQPECGPVSSKSALKETMFKPGAEGNGGIHQGKGWGKVRKPQRLKNHPSLE